MNTHEKFEINYQSDARLSTNHVGNFIYVIMGVLSTQTFRTQEMFPMDGQAHVKKNCELYFTQETISNYDQRRQKHYRSQICNYSWK